MPALIKKILIRILRNTAGRYYEGARLSKAKAPADPFSLFADWYDIARQVDPDHYNAMTLATAAKDFRPSARMVLLKSFDQQGFVFYTNYHSRKALELENNPQASLVFWWKEVYRQVRVEGGVEKVSDAESDAYFSTRPRGSQLGAWASRQSSVLASRAELEGSVADFEKKFQNREVIRPPFWGGFRLKPHTIDFWQGRQDRLHDRLHYNKTEDEQWALERLAP